MLQAKDFNTVTAGEWGVSVTTGTGITGCILNVYVRSVGPGETVECPECNGKQFAHRDEAYQSAFEHGHLIPYISRRWGLRFTGEAWFPEISHNILETVNRLKMAR